MGGGKAAPADQYVDWVRLQKTTCKEVFCRRSSQPAEFSQHSRTAGKGIPSMSTYEGFTWMDPWVSQHLTGSFTCVVTSITDTSKIFEVLGVEPDLDRLHGIAELQDGTSSEEALVGVNITTGSAWCFLADVMGIGLARVPELSQGGMAVCMSGDEHSGVWFTVARSRVTLAECSLSDGGGVSGESPELLTRGIHEVGLGLSELEDGSNHPFATAAALVHLFTGVAITPIRLTDTDFLVGCIPRAAWL